MLIQSGALQVNPDVLETGKQAYRLVLGENEASFDIDRQEPPKVSTPQQNDISAGGRYVSNPFDFVPSDAGGSPELSSNLDQKVYRCEDEP